MIWELFHPSSSVVTDVSVAEALVEPGKETGAHRHLISQEVYYILEGTGRMFTGDKAADVVSGDAVLIKPGTAHNIKNTGEVELRILCVCCPPYSHEDTILEKT
jgi:mannose-6-phosphate isomerase-like protein (cupin superfamily)